MSKKQKPDEITKLEKEVKELKSINRSLMRQLKKQNREYQPEQEAEEIVAEDYKKHDNCEQCGKGQKLITKLGPRVMITCSLCDFRKTKKTNVKEEEL